LVATAACGGSSSDGAAPRSTGPARATTAAPAATTSPQGGAPVGFDTVAARVTAADGATCDVCLWAALTADQRTRGLMDVTDLSGADGMVFRFGAATTGEFWMLDTPTPLSIAFYDADGVFVSSIDMAPCVDTPSADCARYAAAGPYADAVEVAQGKLPSLLMTAGSQLEILDAPCPLKG
jgi:uncharacterized membrane protein (UPF0127 family)